MPLGMLLDDMMVADDGWGDAMSERWAAIRGVIDINASVWKVTRAAPLHGADSLGPGKADLGLLVCGFGICVRRVHLCRPGAPWNLGPTLCLVSGTKHPRAAS